MGKAEAAEAQAAMMQVEAGWASRRLTLGWAKVVVATAQRGEAT